MPDPMQLIQIESLLMKTDMFSLAVIMFIAVTRMEVFKSFKAAGYICKVYQRT